jgi:hypothetical protein
MKTIRKVLAQHPDLCYHGFRYMMTDEQFAESRADLLTPKVGLEIETAVAFIAIACRKGYTHRMRSSYSLKHAAELWGRHVGLEPYVANGSLITAALILEVPFTRWDYSSPNCGLPIKERSRVMDEIRDPRPAKLWGRRWL